MASVDAPAFAGKRNQSLDEWIVPDGLSAAIRCPGRRPRGAADSLKTAELRADEKEINPVISFG